MLSYRSPVPRTRFCDWSAGRGFSVLGISSACIIYIQSHDSVSHQQTVPTKCMFLLVVTGDVPTLLLCSKANHHKPFTGDFFRAITHMVPLPHTRRNQVDIAVMLTYIGASELPGWTLAWTTLFCVAHSEFTQSLLSDARRCSIRQRPIPEPFQFFLSSQHTSNAIFHLLRVS